MNPRETLRDVAVNARWDALFIIFEKERDYKKPKYVPASFFILKSDCTVPMFLFYVIRPEVKFEIFFGRYYRKRRKK